jgi:hypothetical protein
MFRHGFAGYDGTTRTQVVGFRFNPEDRIAIALGICRGNAALRGVILGDVLDLISAEKGAKTNRESEPEADAYWDVGEISGTYVGSHGYVMSVAARHGQITLTMRRRNGSAAQMHGRIDGAGQLDFDALAPGLDPYFFRYSRTNEPCIMIGMHALKKVPVAYM